MINLNNKIKKNKNLGDESSKRSNFCSNES